VRLVISLALLFACLGCLLLAACVVPSTSTGAGPTPTPTPPTTRTTDLHVMSFNIRYGTAQDGDNHWTRRREGLFALLAHEAPDLIGLQEALKFQVDEMLAAMPHYGAVFAGRDDGEARGEACAILYDRRRFTLDSHATFWLSDTPDVVSNTWNAACLRICTWAHLRDTATGRAFYFYNTHLDHMNEDAREKGIRLVLDRIAARPDRAAPALLTGDFNDGERSDTVRLAARELIDTFRTLHPSSADPHHASTHPHYHGVGTFNGFKNKTDGEKIDYILATPGLQVLKADIVRTTHHGHNVSDHFPVTATLRF